METSSKNNYNIVAVEVIVTIYEYGSSSSSDKKYSNNHK